MECRRQSARPARPPAQTAPPDRERRHDPNRNRPVVAGPGHGAPDPGASRPGPGRRLRPQRPAAPPEALPALSRRGEAEGRHQPGEVRGRGVAPRRSRPVGPGGRRAGRAVHAAAGRQEGRAERGRAPAGGDLDPGRPRRDRGGERSRAQPGPAADPPAVRQHDPRPARRRHPAGRRLPRRRRGRGRVRQQRLDPVRPADPHGEVPGGGRRRARAGGPGAIPRRPARPGPPEGGGRPALRRRVRPPRVPSPGRATTRSTA